MVSAVLSKLHFCPVPPVHYTSATLDTFQVLDHIKFFSTLESAHLLFPLLEHIFFNFHLFGFFSSFRSQQTITYSKSLSLTTLLNVAHCLSWVILCHSPCFILYSASIMLLIYLLTHLSIFFYLFVYLFIYLAIVIPSAPRIMSSRCVCIWESVCTCMEGRGSINIYWMNE